MKKIISFIMLCVFVLSFSLIANASPQPEKVPLYRYWSGSNSDHFYTTNFDELGNGRDGYVLERIQGYVYTSPHAGTVPLYRYWNSESADHFYTTDFDELGNGKDGYVFEGIQCYVFPHGSRIGWHQHRN